jgi:hypothetical protein
MPVVGTPVGSLPSGTTPYRLYTSATRLASPDGLYGIVEGSDAVVPSDTPVVNGVYDFTIGTPWTFYQVGLNGELVQEYATTDLGIFPVYVDLDYVNSYFSAKLHSEGWFSAIDEDKIKAIIQASQAIDNLNFHGFKRFTEQPLEFPRSYYRCRIVDIPLDNLQKAVAEVAYSFNDGIDIEQEIAGLRVTSRGYSSVRTTYDANRPPENLIAGIPSITAWNLLRPYVNTSDRLRLRRVS